MINEQNNYSEREGADVSALLATLKRVETPGDFNFRVKARIAQGRPVTTARASWATMALRLSLPAVVMATAGGYLGYRTLSSDNFDVAVINDVQATSPVTSKPAQSFAEPATTQTQPVSEPVLGATSETLALTLEQPSRTAKPTPKSTSTAKPEEERAGGSYDTAVRSAETITQPDEDDNDPKPPVRKVLVSASQFLAASGISATSSAGGGRIQSVSGAAAQAGLKAGDVIESVSVSTGVVRVTRDGKSLTVVIR